ncbi:branched-chain amino acid transport system substrate-binding protein [Nocardioides terrae]|uniref:Branched-chain amino acid transport system substrate-binding protein n=1 Tax=Nocardioides terrae TaxID=574651 RepID=A0A1I1F6R5_9ACTN|nr:ABC transporter substrate-binding protein [Nocardioides terrae]SFB93408.1 branched-chain amino acid transport system substrate-binding protein [Nocardioides terrae]
MTPIPTTRRALLRHRAQLSAGAALLLVTSACGSSDSEGSTTAVPDAKIVAPVAGMTCNEGTKPTGDPIVVGGSLSLTGPLSETAKVHEGVAELVTKWVNDCGGIDGRPLKWDVLDDQSTPAQVASNYERLIGEHVDLVMGPYGGANTLAAAGPVTQAGYAFPTHTNGAPQELIGENHFPAWQFDGTGDKEHMFDAGATTLWDALKSSGNPPKSVFYATAKFPTTLSLAAAAKSRFEKEGVKTTGDVEYEFGTTDFSSIALRISQADPDLVYLGGLGADTTYLYDAFDSIGYTPRSVFAALPSPASLAGLDDEVNGLLTLSIFETDSALGDTDIARYFGKQYDEVAKDDDLFPLIETQAAASFAAWQILLTGVVNAGVDNKAIIAWLNSNSVDTIAGSLKFDGYNNYGGDINRVTQIQDGKRVLVWPKDVAGGTIDYKP